MKRITALYALFALFALAPQAGAAEQIARAQFTTGVVDREPVDEVTTLSNDHSRVFFFSEQHGMAGQSVTHRWEYNGQVMAEVSFDIGGSRWRVHSSKNLVPQWLGEWKVAVVDGAGTVLTERTFTYTEAAH